MDDFQPFVAAGITTFDTADIYGPSETLIGDFLERRDAAEPPVQVLTKFCCFGDDMRSVSADSVREVRARSHRGPSLLVATESAACAVWGGPLSLAATESAACAVWGTECDIICRTRRHIHSSASLQRPCSSYRTKACVRPMTACACSRLRAHPPVPPAVRVLAMCT